MEEQMRNDEMEIDLIELFHVLLQKSVGDTSVSGHWCCDSRRVYEVVCHTTVSGDIYDLCSW